MTGRGRVWVAAGVVAAVVLFWVGIAVAAALEPGYAHHRDYVSTLAARGAAHAGIAILAIVAAAAAMAGVALLVRPLSGLAAAAIALAGAGFVAAAFTRLDCPNGAAGCGLGGRFEVSGGVEIGHWTATTVSTVLLIAGMGLAGLALVQRGLRAAGLATIASGVLTAAAFLATGGDEPGVMQRVGIVVATGWLAAVAVAVLMSRTAPAE